MESYVMSDHHLKFKGPPVVILESMKMEIAVEADNRGTITRIVVEEGQVVDQDTVLMELS
jgi:biotin carboxyl carrier protein